ncbi:AI-2E family transporter [Homoserinibacter sp. YIM 151385]|uniref:AI-2E family transporter n=1 Tax=Homoserinibacter sp. YIM 151385 TaxID=2985506 RepID=UPI0022F07B6A|nr:AI-2E family transporter [Homoserinibacter sp. YIM 151385]WBU38060.1 AI-2E family transporter [Homoserinibacter sp. YIM 151385]
MVFRSREDRARAATDNRVSDGVPPGMRIAAAWSWRLLVVAGLIALLGFLIVQLRLIVIPFLIAVVLSALLVPFCNWLQRHRWPRGLAVAVTELGVIAVVAGLITLVVQQVRSGAPALQAKSIERYDDLKALLLDSPLHLTEQDINEYVAELVKAVQADTSALVTGALDVGSTAGHVLAGILLVLFSTLFLLLDGRRIFRWVTRLFPRRAQRAVIGGGEAGWATLTTFVKVQIFVAFVDAVGIGLGAWILGLFFGGFPLVIPIAVAVFLGAFIPVVGAVLTGALAVFVALVYFGPIPALIMLGIVILVQQIEGHVLQPLVMGTAVKIHPLAVVLAVAAGGFIAGIPGAFFAVPVVAVLNVVVGYIARGEWRSNPHPSAEDVT